ncbi:redoxin domain-containing protein [Nocardioides guangzhouensis]|uniref:Redoxin domain-containing protein n=1 Tax=Nocardioides guangzhouensis TaxID=2497878 RepID=A0A4Q4ZE23_9ACTN|nr:redoxin domain-containing protein [Nocardioides guangzhouensis]RYP86303.1 redoxin domain-containing protein [Nocardioides guangzhouensis]
MAAEPTLVPLGTALPPFALPDLDGGTVTSDAFAGAPLLVAFLCNHCPYVKHVEVGLADLLTGTPEPAVVGICSNDAEEAHPADGVAGLRDQVARAGWERLHTPVLIRRPRRAGVRRGASAVRPRRSTRSSTGRR